MSFGLILSNNYIFKKFPSILFHVNLGKNNIFFKFYGKWFAKELKKITLIFVQDEESNNLA